jgi:hypothetical protein
MRAALVAVAAFALAAPALAGDGPMAQMNFFVGCWRGQFSGPAHLGDDRCFEPMQGGTYVRDTHQVRGAPSPYGGESIYYLDAEAHKLAVIYFSSDGGVERGFAEPDGHGGLIFPPGTYVDADGTRLTLRASWVVDGPDRYVATSETLDHGEWKSHLRITYTRSHDLTAPVRP